MKRVRWNCQDTEDAMNPCAKSCVDSPLIPPGLESGDEIDGRDSWNGSVPAEETVMSVFSSKTTPTIDKMIEELEQQYMQEH